MKNLRLRNHLVSRASWLTTAVLSLATVFAVPAMAAQPKTTSFEYTCEIEARRTGGWTPSETRFTINESDMTVVVMDPIIEWVEDQPVTTKAKRVKSGMLRFKWRLSVPNSEWARTSVAYRIDFDPETETGTMRVAAAGGLRDAPGKLVCK